MHTEGSETGGGACEPPLAPTLKKLDLQYKTHNVPPGVDLPRGFLGLGLHDYTLTISGRLYRAIFILGCICMDTYRYIHIYILLTLRD
jgi:hypothetical protein